MNDILKLTEGVSWVWGGMRLDYNADNFTGRPDWLCQIHNIDGAVKAYGNTAEEAVTRATARMLKFEKKLQEYHESLERRGLPVETGLGRMVTEEELKNMRLL